VRGVENIARRVDTLTSVDFARPREISSAAEGSRGGILNLITTLPEMEALSGDWRELEARAAGSSNIFQTYGWCSAWAKNYAKPRMANELCILTGYQAGRLVFLWPLMRTTTGPVTILRWLSEPFAQYGDILLARGADGRAWVRASLDLIRRLKGVDGIRLRHVRADSTIFPFVNGAFRRGGQSEAAPFLDLAAFATEDDYEKRYGKEQRRRRKRIRNELEKTGPVNFELMDAGNGMDSAIEEALKEKRQWLSARGLYSRPIACSLIGQFLRELSHARTNSPAVVTSRLTAGERTVSWEIGLRFGGTHFGFITAHDTMLTDASPARLHMDLSQRQAIKDGMNIFDLMVPADPHKESWSNGQVDVHDFHLPTSTAGRLYGRLYLEWFRPLMRKAYYRASPALRRPFTAWALG